MYSFKQVLLVVLDGWGYRPETDHNAIFEANTPFFDSLWKEYPHSFLEASGVRVGLPEGQIGTSEVGHMTMGAGKVIDTDLVRISKAIEKDQLIKNPSILKLFKQVKKNNSTLHLLGLIGPGGVHSHSDHLYGTLKAAKDFGLTKIAIHAFTDGRDTPPASAKKYLVKLEQFLGQIGVGFIASISGRFFGMDRDNNLDRVRKVVAAVFDGKGLVSAKKPSQVIHDSYQKQIFDEQIEPVVFSSQGKLTKVNSGDGIFFINFRADRARQLSREITRKITKLKLCFVTMTEYEKGLNSHVAFLPNRPNLTLSEIISKANLIQVHIAETEKAAHATYFFNGGREIKLPGEKYIIIESHKVRTHDELPQMRAQEIAEAAVAEIKRGTNFIMMNFANADMVAHTANKPAVIKALEFLDLQLQKVVSAANETGAIVLITADHGNAELSRDPQTGQKHTAHTNNLVPAILTLKGVSLKNGDLSNVAPTILQLLGLDKPTEMTSSSLIRLAES